MYAQYEAQCLLQDGEGHRPYWDTRRFGACKANDDFARRRLRNHLDFLRKCGWRVIYCSLWKLSKGHGEKAPLGWTHVVAKRVNHHGAWKRQMRNRWHPWMGEEVLE